MNLENVLTKRTMIENDIATQMNQDEETRKAFMENLPEFIGDSIKELLNDMSENEFRSCYTRSGDDFIQYEIRVKAVAGNQINHKEVRNTEMKCGFNNAAGRWMEKLLKHDADHIAQLHHPKYSGGGMDQYLREGLFNTDNLGDINHKFTEVIKKAAGTDDHVRLLVGSDWGVCRATLTLTFPKKINLGGN